MPWSFSWSDEARGTAAATASETTNRPHPRQQLPQNSPKSYLDVISIIPAYDIHSQS